MTAFLRHLRARAGRYALAVAVCQVAVLSASTIVLAASPHDGSLHVAAGEECTCDHTSGVMCPMHKRAGARPVPANAPRWCKGVDDSSFAVLPALGALALPEQLTELLPQVTATAVAAIHADAPRLLDRPPDSPPPRA